MLPHLRGNLTSPASYNAAGNQHIALFGQDQFFGSDLSVETALCMYGPYMSLPYLSLLILTVAHVSEKNKYE